MSIEQAIGVVALAVGVFDLALYVRYRGGSTLEQRFRKLGPMRQRLGSRAGTAVHVTAYVVLPLVAGAVLLWQG